MLEGNPGQKRKPHIEPLRPDRYSVRQGLGLFLGPILLAVMLLVPTPRGMSPEAQKMAAVALLMSVWWITEAIPIPATSLLPLVLFPLLGIVIGKSTSSAGLERLKQAAAEVARPYAHHLIFLFLGGFMIALAMQRWNLHRRIAINIVRRLSYSPSVLILGFMVATAFLSMWISNSATTMMMLPIALAVVAHISDQEKRDGNDTTRGAWNGRFAVCMMLGIAYAASIGGVGTLIGTPPNVLLARHLEEELGKNIDFLEWMRVGVPFVVLFLPIAWLVLTRLLFRIGNMRLPRGKELIEEELRALGRMSRAETMTAIVFVMTALGWVFLEPKEIAGRTIPGIQTLLPGVQDSTIAMIGALLLFILPVDLKRGEFVLNWHWASRLPWGVILLFGGGFALAGGFTASGLDRWISQQVEVFKGGHVLVLIAATVTLLIFLTELTSNTATTSMALPVFTGIAVGLGHDPILLLVPLTIAASCAFMLPVATPPNAIVFGSGLVSIPQMAKAGLILNIIGIALVTGITYLLVIPLFHVVLR
jgi:sodium-dependent dicarboxylate transporter 2/3/5